MSGVDPSNATSLALVLFLEGAIVACEDGRGDVALRMGMILLDSVPVPRGMTGATIGRVLRDVVRCGVGSSRGGEDKLVADVIATCDAELHALDGHKFVTASSDAYRRVLDVLSSQVCSCALCV